jgi:hypothetical protein
VTSSRDEESCGHERALAQALAGQTNPESTNELKQILKLKKVQIS